MLAINKVLIIHYSPLKERKESLINQLSENNIKNVVWVEEEPEDNLKICSSDLWENKFLEMGVPSIKKRELTKSENSMNYKHLKAYEYIVKNKIDSCLVLEDDVIFDENFCSKFNLNLSMTPKDWDFIFIGSGCNLRIPRDKIKEGIVAYKKEHPASKCTDSYLIKKESAEKILKTIVPFTYPIDFELNYQMFKYNMNVYWWDPPISKQGSQCGIFRRELVQ